MRIAKVGPCRSLPVDALRTGVVPDTGLDPTPVVTLHSNRAVYLNVNHYGTREILNWTSFSPASSIQLIFLFVCFGNLLFFHRGCAHIFPVPSNILFQYNLNLWKNKNASE